MSSRENSDLNERLQTISEVLNNGLESLDKKDLELPDTKKSWTKWFWEKLGY